MQRAASTDSAQASAASEDLVDAFWEFVIELKCRREALQMTRTEVAEMANAMLEWHSPDLGFIRRASFTPAAAPHCCYNVPLISAMRPASAWLACKLLSKVVGMHDLIIDAGGSATAEGQSAARRAACLHDCEPRAVRDHCHLCKQLS